MQSVVATRSASAVIIAVLDTRDNEQRWNVVKLVRGKRRRAWMPREKVEAAIARQVEYGFEEPVYQIKYVGIKFRPAWDDMPLEERALAKRMRPTVDDPRFVKRAVHWQGFAKPTIMSLVELRERGIAV